MKIMGSRVAGTFPLPEKTPKYSFIKRIVHISLNFKIPRVFLKSHKIFEQSYIDET